MGVLRDRVGSGKKAAQTNQRKRPDFYGVIGTAGGLVTGVAKGLAKRSKEAREAQAAMAARRRHGIDDGNEVQYVVTVPTGSNTFTARTRESARAYKRLMKDEKQLVATITRVEYAGNAYEGAPIISSKEVW